MKRILFSFSGCCTRRSILGTLSYRRIGRAFGIFVCLFFGFHAFHKLTEESTKQLDPERCNVQVDAWHVAYQVYNKVFLRSGWTKYNLFSWVRANCSYLCCIIFWGTRPKPTNQSCICVRNAVKKSVWPFHTLIARTSFSISLGPLNTTGKYCMWRFESD